MLVKLTIGEFSPTVLFFKSYTQAALDLYCFVFLQNKSSLNFAEIYFDRLILKI